MSNTTSALLFKLLMTFIITWLTIGFMAGNSLLWVFIVAVLITAINYLLGDLLILPKAGNLVAAIADGLLAAVIVYIMSVLISGFLTPVGTLITFAIILAIGEFFFHIYLLKDDKVAPNPR